MDWIEILGIVAGIMVAISLVMKSMGALRWINMIGCILFTIWGLMTGSIGVWICNGFGVLVNIYRMLELRGVLHSKKS